MFCYTFEKLYWQDVEISIPETKGYFLQNVFSQMEFMKNWTADWCYVLGLFLWNLLLSSTEGFYYLLFINVTWQEWTAVQFKMDNVFSWAFTDRSVITLLLAWLFCPWFHWHFQQFFFERREKGLWQRQIITLNTLTIQLYVPTDRCLGLYKMLWHLTYTVHTVLITSGP